MSPSGPPGFIVGLAIEAGLLTDTLGPSGRIACAAASAERARAGARRLLAEGAGALVSFGIAGGLDPDLTPGDLVLAERVVSPDGVAIVTDPDLRAQWQRAAEAAGLRGIAGSLLGTDRALTSVADKKAWQRSSGAVAVDMESHAVAGIAADAGVPFLAVRAIADPAGRPLPRAAAGCIGPDGRTRVGQVVLGVCLRPWEVLALLRLRRDADAALASLGRLVGGLGSAGLV